MSDRENGTAGILLWMAVFVVVGAPFVYLIWNFVNHVLTGRFEIAEAGLAVVGGVGVWAILRFVASRAARWEEEGSP